MKKRIILILVVIYNILGNIYAQNIEVYEEFSDGELHSSPTWVGDTSDFIVSNYQARLNGNKADTSYISTSILLNCDDTLQWQFWLKHNSLTSNNSYFRFYFYANNLNPETSSDALFLEIKPRPTALMAICRQNNTDTETLIEENFKSVSTNAGQLRIKALRYPDGSWNLYIDTLGGINFTHCLSFVELENATLEHNCFISLWCKYTSSDKNKFFLDDIEAKILRNRDTNTIDNEIVPLRPNDLLINEVLFNPYIGGEDFVEIYNNTDSIINLSTVCLATWDNINMCPKTVLPLPDSAVIYPHDYMVISSNIEFLKNNYTVKYLDKLLYISKMPSYPNSSGSVVLTLTDSTIIDRFDYSEDMHYRWLDDVEGISLERRSFDYSTASASNWHSAAKSVGWATPTYNNSQAINLIFSEDMFTIEPNIFSPDNDGYNDLLNICYQTTEENLLVNISIFDNQGRNVKTLERNALLGTNGAFVWDGSNDEGRRCNIGNYIVYIEVYNTVGSMQRFKKAITLMLK